MAAVLASHSCCRHHFEHSDLGRERHGISFSGSMSNIKFVKLDTSQTDWRVTMGPSRFLSEVRPAESDKLGSNVRVIKMVPTKEALKSKGVFPENARSVNGSKEAANDSDVAINGSMVSVNGVKLGANGAKLVKRDGTSTTVLVKTHENTSYDFSFNEELNILPSDEGFSWAKDDYNLWQRTVDIWSFVLSLRLRVMFDNAKWAYPGGFTEEKQCEMCLKRQRMLLRFSAEDRRRSRSKLQTNRRV